MRMSDWSSDVCSSDLLAAITGKRRDRARLLDLSRVCSTGDQDAHPDGDEERESFGALRRAELLYDRKDQWPERLQVQKIEDLDRFQSAGRVAVPLVGVGPVGCHKIGRASCRARVCQYV